MLYDPKNMKEITDNEKSWFDYVGYLLRISAWFLAIAYASHHLLRPQPPGSGPLLFEWTSVAVAFVFGIFLIVRFMSMSIKMVNEIASNVNKNNIRERFLFGIIWFWLIFGIPAFLISVTGEIVELYLEKFK